MLNFSRFAILCRFGFHTHGTYTTAFFTAFHCTLCGHIYDFLLFLSSSFSYLSVSNPSSATHILVTIFELLTFLVDAGGGV